jgi:hypothetical protein
VLRDEVVGVFVRFRAIHLSQYLNHYY